jgi:hypothetical protein
MMTENVLHKRLKFHAYRIQILHEIVDKEWYRRIEFAILMLNSNDQGDSFLWQVVHRDEIAFQKNGYINTHNRCT